MHRSAAAFTDSARSAALRELGFLDAPADATLDRLTQLAARVVAAPTVLITLVDGPREVIVGGAGMREPLASSREIPIAHSFCQHVVASGRPMVLRDARHSRRVRASPLIREMSMVAYAGFPLRDASARVLGAFCAIDYLPRRWVPEELSVLEEFAALAGREVELRQALRAAGEAEGARLRAEETLRAESPFRALVEAAHVGIYVVRDGRVVHANPAFAATFGYTPEEVAGLDDVLEVVRPDDRERVAGELERCAREPGGSLRLAFDGRRRDGSPVRVEVEGDRMEFGGTAAVVGTVLDVTERARAEEALRRGQLRFRAIFDGAFHFCGLLSPAGEVLEVNRTVLDFAGVGPAEVVGLPCWEARWWLPDPDREARLRAAVARAAAGERVRWEEEVRGADGAVAAVDFSLRPVAGEDGRAEGVIFEGWDVSEQRRVQRSLQEREERLRLVERATDDVIWDWNPDTGRLVWNDAGPRRFRYAPAEVTPSIEWHTERVHPDDRERVVGGIHEVLSGVGDFWSAEYRLLRGDGSYATVLDRAYVVRGERGDPVRVIGSMMDVTERRRIEEGQRFLARASALLDSSMEIRATLAGLARLCVPTLADCCILDLAEPDGGVRRAAVAHANPALEELLDRDTHHPPGADLRHHPAARVIRDRQPLIVAGAPAGGAEPDGPGAPTLLDRLGVRSYMVVPLVSHDRVLGALTLAATDPGRRFRPVDLVLAEDLAQRVALSIENARLYERAQQAVLVRDEVLGVVSHDLRNPLNTILMSTALLSDAGGPRAGGAQWLDVIRRAAEQMTHMIGDLLDVSTIEAGHFTVAPAGHEASEVVDEALAMLGPLAAAEGLRLECSTAPGTPAVWVDPHQILRVLSNLVGNAIKFTPRGGTVTVRAERWGAEVRFRVTDTGPGIPAEQVEHVFDRFWQARGGDRRGAGLGLAIARGIVAAHGGRIWVESRPGCGATFHFTVPCHGGDPARSHEAA